MGKHNAQAAESPLASPSWQLQLDNPVIRKNILAGTFYDDSLPPEINEFLASFQQTKPAPSIPFSYSFTRFCSYVKKTKEKIASSPSGRHLGHYKTLLRMKHKKLLHAIFDIMSLSMKYSIILDRFLGVALTLLEKDEGSPKIHRLRPIALVETELNCIAKAHWAQDMMASIEKHNLITDDQYGGRKGKQAHSAVLNKLLYYNIQHQLVESAVFIDKDARNCFDRFIPNLITLENEALGSPPEASQYMLNILRNQNIQARTCFGITSAKISDVSNRPHFGSGQGIGWSGQACAASLNSVSRALSQNSYGLYYISPDTTTSISTSGDCFVDDTELGINQAALPPTADLLHEASKTDQKHTYYWFTTGGLNANDKGSWYYVNFTFIHGKPHFASISDSPATLHTHPKFSAPSLLTPRLEYNEAHTTLGCTVAPNMDPSAQLNILQQLTTYWVRKVGTSFLSPIDKLRSYHCVWLPKLAYRLSLTCFSYDHCDSLMKIVTPSLLHASHFHKNFSRDLTFAPPQYGGLSIPHMFYVLIQAKAKLFSFHYRKQDKTGKLFKISIDTTQLQCGLSTPFYTLDYRRWRHILTPTWFLHLWSLLSICDISISLSHHWIYIPPRINDQFVMDLLLPHIPSTSVHYCLNACRIALQIITLSDLTTPVDGLKVLPNILQGNQYRSSNIKWPNQEIPHHWWSTWKQYLSSYIVPYLSLHKLGAWTSESHQTFRWRQLSPTSIISPLSNVYTTTSLSRFPRYFSTNATSTTDISHLPIIDVLPAEASYQVIASTFLPVVLPPPLPSFDY